MWLTYTYPICFVSFIIYSKPLCIPLTSIHTIYKCFTTRIVCKCQVISRHYSYLLIDELILYLFCSYTFLYYILRADAIHHYDCLNIVIFNGKRKHSNVRNKTAWYLNNINQQTGLLIQNNSNIVLMHVYEYSFLISILYQYDNNIHVIHVSIRYCFKLLAVSQHYWDYSYYANELLLV